MRRTKGIGGIVAIIIVGAIALGSVTAADASTISRQEAALKAREYLQVVAFSFKGSSAS
jgi:hypothetical protein